MGRTSNRSTAVFDLDGTLVRGDTYLAFLMGYLLHNPARLGRAGKLPLAVALHFGGKRDNSWLKVQFLRGILGGDTKDQIEMWASQFVRRLIDKKVLREGLQCMSRHRREGHRLVLATASPDIYVRLLGERLGFDDVICTRFQWDDSDRLTGELDGDNCYGDVKRAKVETYIDGQNYSGALFVYTDHHSDLPLLRVATCPVAVNPTPSLKRAASELGIPIVRW